MWAILIDRRRHEWHGGVKSVSPQRVAGFWTQGQSQGEAHNPEDDTLHKASVKKDVKGAKIDVIGRALNKEEELKFEGQAKLMREAYLHRWLRKKTDHPETPKQPKLDDLADCLLQGLTWVRWEQNRRAIVEKGLDALD